MTSLAKPMRSWGDLNAALNALVHVGAIEGFRTNRDAKNADPAVVLIIAANMKEASALYAVRGVLTGAFADTTLSVEVTD